MLKKRGLEIDTFKFNLDDNDRCILEGSVPGCFVKVFCKRGTDEIVGGVVVSERAGEILAEIVLAMQHGIGLSKSAGLCTHIPLLVKQFSNVAFNSIEASGSD